MDGIRGSGDSRPTGAAALLRNIRDEGGDVVGKHATRDIFTHSLDAPEHDGHVAQPDADHGEADAGARSEQLLVVAAKAAEAHCGA